MVEPVTAFIVTTGVYDDYRFLAVFTGRSGAQEFADHHNLTTDRYSGDDRAQVEEIGLYGAGWRRPPLEVPGGDLTPTIAGERPGDAPLRPRAAIRTAPGRIAQGNGGGQ